MSRHMDGLPGLQPLLRPKASKTRRQVTEQAGFSTLEVVVAFAILAIAIAVTFETISAAMGQLKRARYEVRASELVRTVLAEQLPQAVLARGEGPSRRSALDWKLELTPLEGDGPPITMVEIEIAPAADGRFTHHYLTFMAGSTRPLLDGVAAATIGFATRNDTPLRLAFALRRWARPNDLSAPQVSRSSNFSSRWCWSDCFPG